MHKDVAHDGPGVPTGLHVQSSVSPAWSRWIVCAAFVVCFFPSLRWLVERWTESGGYGHGFLVVPAALYFVHQATFDGRGPPRGAVFFRWVLAGASLLWAFANVGSVEVVQDALLPLLFAAGFAALFGWQGLRGIALPTVLFALAVPFWEQMVLPLQLLTARVVGSVLTVFDFTVLVEGDLVHVPSGTFEIAGGCSGLRFLLVASTLTTMYGALYLRALRSRTTLVLTGIALALVVNWVRVAVIIVIGDELGMQHRLVQDHAWLGWVVFAIGLIPLFWFARKLELADLDAAEPAAAAATPAVGTGQPSVAAVLALVLAMGVGPFWAFAAARLAPSPTNLAMALPVLPAPWGEPLPPSSSWRPRFAGATAETLGRYEDPDGDIHVYGNVYLWQSQGGELIGNANALEGDWYVLGRDTHGDMATLLARPRIGRSEWLIWYWYEIGGRRTASALTAKIYQGAMGLVGDPRAGIIVLATECSSDCTGASTRLEAFVSTVRPALSRLMTFQALEEEP